MNIWLIQIGEALPVKAGIRKLRTAYLADKLIQRGHDVLWWASAFDHFEKRWLYDNDKEVTLD
ncbi:MAG: glycosyltransferase WbuB, partial [Candidatus Hodarchaeota archaeon]